MPELVSNNNTVPPEAIVDFGPDAVPTAQHCSRHKCAAGHEWAPKLAIVNCPGCGQHMVALLMSNCPVCNEPTDRTFVRVDHLPQGGAITPICKGSETMAEATMVILTHSHYVTEEQRYKDREVLSKV